MNFSRIVQIIKEEVQNWFDDEPSIADRIYQKRGITPTQQTPTSHDDVSGEFVGYLMKTWAGGKYNQPIPIYRNPKNLRGYDLITRGVLVGNGDIYVSKLGDGLHIDILYLLAKEGIIPVDSIVPNYTQIMPEEYITIIRMGNNRFTQSEGYEEFPEYYEVMFEEANQIQPFTFVVSH